MKLRQVPCYTTPTPGWADCAWALRQCLAAHGCLTWANLLKVAATALDTEDLARLETTLIHLIRTTDVGGTALTARCASAPPRLLQLETGRPLVKLGEFPGCNQRALNRIESIENAQSLLLEQWEGPKEKLDRAYIQSQVEQLLLSPPQEHPGPVRESYNVTKSSWSRQVPQGQEWTLQRTSLGKRWRFYLSSATRWIEIDQDSATRLRFALHLQAESPVPAHYEPHAGGIRVNVPFLPSQEFRTLSLTALEPIAFGTPFGVHPEFSQFALNYLNERLGLAFQEAKL